MPNRIFVIIHTLTLLLVYNSCTDTHSVSTSEEADQGARAARLFEQYYQDWLTLHPLFATTLGDNRYNDQLPNTISESYRAKLKDLYSTYLDSLSQLDYTELSEADHISADFLKWQCELNLEDLAYPMHLMPMTQFDNSLQYEVARMASSTSTQPFKTVKDYEDWLKRLHAYTAWCDTAIVNMKKGIAAGYVLPIELTEKMMIPIKEWSTASVEDHLFYSPISRMPDDFPEADKQRLTTAYFEMVGTKIIPAFQRLYEFLQTEYLPAGRHTAGVSALPNGKSYYQYQILYYTSTDATADEIYELGLQEVARIEAEVKNIMQEAGFEGSVKEFLTYVREQKQPELLVKPEFEEAQQVLDYYYDVYEQIKPHLADLFDKVPQTPFEIRQTEAFRENTTPPQYIPGTPDGSRPGVFYVPIPNVKQATIQEALFLHEAIPGHHFQISLQLENTNLPNFRRNFTYEPYAFIEGWGLYAESLGKELGLYTDPYQYFGMLSSEIFRAARLVVDAGIHNQGWSREQAIQYLFDHSILPEAQVISEVERYMAWPGQALSYKVGQLKILELRAMAEQELGDNFDIKQFHNVVLETGAVPLEILEQIIKDWVQQMKK